MERDYLKRIERFISGNADDEDKKYLESLLAEGEDNPHLRNMIKQDWESGLNEPSSDEFNSVLLLDAIHKSIWKKEVLKKHKPINRLIRIYMKAAAILLLPAVISGLYFLFQAENATPVSNETSSLFNVYAPPGSRVNFTLPDGTRGILNGGSEFEYTVPFENRQIKLEGEAWFSVKHDSLHPFQILTKHSRIEVLGTKLNVSAYQEEEYVEVVLQEGNVDFYPDNLTEKVSMQPSDRLILQNGILHKSMVDTAKFTSWTKGKLIFRGDNMSEVARRIERWYNVNVRIADYELEKYSFRATFQDDPVEEVIRCLALTSPIKYEIIPRTISEDGVYKKIEIIIYKSR